jgi:hypothetical protein
MTAHTIHRWAIEYREADGHCYLRHRPDSNEAMTFATRSAARAWLTARKGHGLKDARVVPVVVETRVAA